MKISMKKRKIGYTYGSVSGYFSFRKEKSIAFESTLERDLLTILEFNDSVEDVVEQPITIEYTNRNGRQVTYTPDFLVFFNEPDASLLKIQRKPLLIEVKPHEKLLKHFKEMRYKFKTAIKYAQANDMVFKIFDERKIRTQYLKNINFLKKYLRFSYDTDIENEILSYVNALGDVTVDNILEYFFITDSQKAIGIGQIWNLLASKKLLCDYRKELSLKTLVWVNDTLSFGETI